MKLFSVTFLVRWFASVTQSYFTAINRPGYAIAITTTMTFVFPVLLLMFLPNLLGLDGIWLTTPIATIGATILAIFFMIRDRVLKNNIKLKNNK